MKFLPAVCQSAAHRRRAAGGFTLVELLITMAVLALVMVLVLSLTEQVRSLFSRSLGQAKSFESARVAYDTITRKIATATLNTYLDYDNPADPKNYVRMSELHFLCGPALELLSDANLPTGELPAWGGSVFFTSPLGFSAGANTGGLSDLLNAGGFFVELGDGALERPAILGTAVPLRPRYRLVEFLSPTEDLRVYSHDPRGLNPAKTALPNDWITQTVGADQGRNIRLLAENIIGVFFYPQTADGEFLTDSNGVYDSRRKALDNPQPAQANQLPQVVRVVMVALDESSALRLDPMETSGKALFEEIFEGLLVNPADNEAVDDDLRTLESRLSEKNLEFRMFNNFVHLGEAKWNE